MLNSRYRNRRRITGSSMLEVLVTIIILTFGMLGLAGFQLRVHTAELESYQRAQALMLLNDMTERINANRVNAATYVNANVIGTGDNQPASCSALAAGVAKDTCEWSNALKGSAETLGGASIGAMIGARGCITLITAANSAAGVCTPGVYEVAVAWQGIDATVAPNKTCGQNLYGTDAMRRLVATQITVGLPTCS